MPTFSAPRARGHAPRAVGDRLEHIRAERRACRGPRAVLLAAGHQRGLAHAQRLQGRANLSMEAHGAKPALRFVLGGMGERNGSSRQVRPQGLRPVKRDLPVVSQETASELPSEYTLLLGGDIKILELATRCARTPVEPDSSHSRIVTWCAARSPSRSSAPQLAEEAVALGHHVVLVDRLEVLLAGRDEGARRRGRRSARRPCGSSRARSPRRSAGCMCAFSTTSTSSGRFISS